MSQYDIGLCPLEVPMGKYDTAGCVPMYDERKLCARVDIDKVKKVNDVNLGDEVTLVVTGKVTNLRGPEENLYKDGKGKERKSTYPGSMEIEISEMKVSAVGEFDGLEEDDD